MWCHIILDYYITDTLRCKQCFNAVVGCAANLTFFCSVGFNVFYFIKLCLMWNVAVKQKRSAVKSTIFSSEWNRTIKLHEMIEVTWYKKHTKCILWKKSKVKKTCWMCTFSYLVWNPNIFSVLYPRIIFF